MTSALHMRRAPCWGSLLERSAAQRWGGAGALWCLALALWALPGWAQGSPPVRLRFSDFFVQPLGPAGLQPTAALLAAQGQQVSLVGWMVAQESPTPGYFLFTARPVRMSEHADGAADDLPVSTILVRLPASQAQAPVPHRAGLLELNGQLHWGRVVAPDGRVSWLQLQLGGPPTD
jgi:hypothetical protein